MLILNIIMSPTKKFAAPIGRLFIALIFVMSGLNKIGSYSNVAGWMESMGVPGALLLLPIVIVFEVLGGLAIIIGWQTRYMALLLSGFCILSALIFHSNFANQNEMMHFMKNLALSGGFLVLVAHGGGNYALDNRARAD